MKATRKLLSDAQQICEDRGVKFTPQRRQVLELICKRNQPCTAYEILDQFREFYPRAAPPTVYRALDFLQEQGFIHKLESLHAFTACPHPDHQHNSQFLICKDCGGVDEIENEDLKQSISMIEQKYDFNCRQHIVELLGVCSACARG